MATPADVADYRQSSRDVVTLATAELAAWWATVDESDPVATSLAVQTFLPQLIHDFGDVAAVMAADFFDGLREQSVATGSFSALLAEAVAEDQIKAVAQWAVSPMFAETPNPAQALSNLEQGTQRLVLQPARQTIAQSVRRDPADAKFARVPQGKTCAFCLMLASRGPVFYTAETAGEFNKYHSSCDCVPTPVWPGDQIPYDHKALYQQYARARRDAGSADLTKILAQLRQNEGVA